MNQSFDRFKQTQSLILLISRIIVSLMMGCVAVSVLQLASRINPGWSGNYLVILVVFISLERLLTFNHINNLDRGPRFAYHIAEWVTFAFGFRLLLMIKSSSGDLVGYLAQFTVNIASIFTGEFVIGMTILAVSWLLSGSFIADIEELTYEELDLKWELGILENRRQSARESCKNRTLWLGLVMLFVAVLTRLDVKALFGPYEALQAPVLNIMAFFLCGLALFCLMQFHVLQGRWIWQHISVPPSIGKSWIKYSVIFIAVVILLAYLLPTRYTFGLLDLVRFTISAIISIVLLITSLVMIPFGWLLSLIPRNQSIEEPIAPTEIAPIIPQAPASQPDPTLQMIQTILFWSVVIGLIIFSVIYYVKANAQAVKTIRISAPAAWLKTILANLMNWFRGGARIISRAASFAYIRFKNLTQKPKLRTRIPLPNFGFLNPGQKVIFFYLKFLERARQNGIRRLPYQTPCQFQKQFIQALPSISAEVQNLTQVFQQAKYSDRKLSSLDSDRARQAWNRIAKSLKSYNVPASPGNQPDIQNMAGKND